MWTQMKLSGVTAFARFEQASLKTSQGSNKWGTRPLRMHEIIACLQYTHTGKGLQPVCGQFEVCWGPFALGWGFLTTFSNTTEQLFLNVRQHFSNLSCTVLLFCPGNSSCLADALGCFPPGWISPFSCQHFCSLMTGFVSWYPLLTIMATEVYYRAG